MKKTTLLILALISMVVVVAQGIVSHCGPHGKCQCYSEAEMSCSGTMIPIEEVCAFIGNSTQKRVSILHLERNRYQHIKENDFNGCDEVTRLYLGRNRITFIENGSFNGLASLESLNIGKNVLPIYNHLQQSFKFPSTLKTLVLSGNPVINLSNDVIYPNLTHLTDLTILYIDGLHGNIFPETYHSLKKLSSLSVSGLDGNCNISEITNSTFKNLPYLTSLNISSCNIKNIDAGAFESLSDLEVLDLSRNLRLGFSVLRNISYGLQFTNIKVLNYSNVYSTFGMGTLIRKQDVCYFWNSTLTELRLDKNRIQLMETNAPALFPETLKSLSVEDNKFTFGPYLLQLGCLTNLDSIFANYQNFPHNALLYLIEPVEMFDKSNNDQRLDCPFMQTGFLLNRSTLRQNCPFFKTDEINSTEFWPTFPQKLKRVEFSSCDMKYSLKKVLIIPTDIEVEYVDFSGNTIYSWEGPIGPFPKLKRVNLSQNRCSYIGLNFFKYVETVEVLQLQENFLGLTLSNHTHGSVIFKDLVNVKVLNLSSNIISYIPRSAFSKMVKLETLDLSVNNLETLVIDVKPLNFLLKLYLKYNFLHNLPGELTNKLEDNTNRHGVPFKIDMENNTLTIFCDEKYFLEWIVKNRIHMINFDNYIFLDKNGKHLSSENVVDLVNGLDKTCRSYTILIVLPSIGLSVFLAIVIGGFVYKNRWQLRYLLRTLKIRHFGYKNLQNDPSHMNFMYDAFISYSNENIRFILDKVIPNLENQGMVLCIHDRDFLPGNNIADNIIDAIRNSRKTIVILSRDFVESKWCIYEFNMARMESIYSREGGNCLVLVLFEDVPIRNMSMEMLDWVRSNTYIEYTIDERGEELFWQNLIDAARG